MKTDPETDAPVEWHAYSDPFNWAKDGKSLFDPEQYPRLMRK